MGYGIKKAVKWGSVGATIAAGLTIKGGISRLMQIDDARAKLKGLGMDSKEIAGIQKSVDAAVTGTAFSLAEGMTAATTAMSSGVKQGKELENYLRLIGDVATQGGTSYGEMADIINQVTARGKVGQENLNRLTERGIGIQSMLADHYGVTGEELQSMLRKGEVSAKDFQTVLEKNFAGSAKKAGDTVRGSFANMRTAFSRLGASFMEPIFTKLPGVFTGITDALKGLQPRAEAAGKVIGDFATKWGPRVLDAFGQVASVTKDTAKWFLENKVAAGLLVGTIGALVTVTKLHAAALAVSAAGGMASWIKSVGIIQKVTKVWAAVQWAMNAALWANPITWVVVGLVALGAALVVAYKKSSTFRDIVQRAWSGIKSAVSSAWNGYIKPALKAFSDFITKTLWPAIQSFYNSVIVPIFTSIGKAIITFWNTNAKPALMAFKSFITDTLWPAIQSFYSTVIAPIFTAIGTVVKTVWTSVIWPVLKAWWSYLTNILFPAIRFLWANVVSPVFSFIGTLIRTVWNGVIRPTLQAWWSYLNNVLFPVIRWLWTNIVQPVFGFIGDRIRSVWNGIIKPAFDAMKKGVEAVGTAFGAAKDAIGTAWDKLKELVKEPIRVAIEFVNDKLIGGINKLLPKKFEIPTIPGFATGGPVYGRGTSTSDSILARLSRGEHVLTAADVRALGGHARVDAMRAAARAGQFHVPGFAKGGAVVPGRGNPHSKAQYPWASYAGDFPNPIGTPVRAWKDGMIALIRSLTTSYGKHVRMNHTDGTSSLYAHLSSFGAFGVGDQVKQGQTIGYVGSTGNSTGPHLHLELMGGPYLGGLFRGGGGGDDESAWDVIKSKFSFSGFIGKLKDKLAGTEGIFSGGRIAAMAGDLAGKIWSYVKDKFKDVASSAIEVNKHNTGFLGMGRLNPKNWNDDGGLNHGRGFMAKNVTAPERVLSPRQTRAFESAMARDFGADGPAKISRDDLDYLAYQIGREVLAGAGAVARGLDDEREYDAKRRARPGLIGAQR